VVSPGRDVSGDSIGRKEVLSGGPRNALRVRGREITLSRLKEPIVNLEENIGKTVGRVRPVDYDRLVAQSRALMPRLPFPKGVYRFKSFEEANEWTEKHILAAAIKKRHGRQTNKI
jgi:hypothetical protein